MPLPRKRVVQLTERMKAFLADNLPEGPGPLDDQTPAVQTPTQITPPQPLIFLRVRRAIKTVKNFFGVSRTYHGRPSGIPDADQSFRELITEDLQPRPPKSRRISDIIFPYPNLNAYRFLEWREYKIEGKPPVPAIRCASPDDFDKEDLRGVLI